MTHTYYVKFLSINLVAECISILSTITFPPLYIGMDEVLARYACRKIPIYMFIFCDNPLLTLQNDSLGQYLCTQNWFEFDHKHGR